MWTRISSRVGLIMAIMAGLFVVSGTVVIILNARVIGHAERMSEVVIPRADLSAMILENAEAMNSSALEYVSGEIEEKENFEKSLALLPPALAELTNISTRRKPIVREIDALLTDYVREMRAGVFEVFDPALKRWAEERASELDNGEGVAFEAYLNRLKRESINEKDPQQAQLYLELVDETGDLLHSVDDYLQGEPRARDRYERQVAEFDSFLEALRETETDTVGKGRVARLEILYDSLRAGAMEIFDGYDPATEVAAIEKIEEQEHARFLPAIALLDELSTQTRDEAQRSTLELVEIASTNRLLVVTNVALILVIAGIITFLAHRTIAAPITDLRSSMTVLAGGDSDIEIKHLGRRDEIGQMADAVRVFKENAVVLAQMTSSLEKKNQVLQSLSSKLSKYLSPQIYEAIFRGEHGGEIATKRKKLTIFFSDVRNFTATTEDLEPEDVTFLVNDYLTEMSAIALAYGATIDKYVGDAILIFFGDPVSKGVREDALACVRMAAAMQMRLRALRAKWRSKGYERPFHIRIGINTGYCDVGNFGSADRMDYTIIGGEVNVAARLEKIAEADGMTLSAETFALVKDYVVAEEGEAVNVKGIKRAIRPFAVKDVVQEQDAEERFIRKKDDGISVFIDLGKLDKDRRKSAAADIEEIAARLRSR